MIIDPYRWHQVRITRITHDSADTVTIRTEKPKEYANLPGQHAIIRITLGDNSTYIRQYSFSCSATQPFLEFTIVRTPGGIVSSWFIDHASTTSIIEISQAFTGPLAVSTADVSHVGMIAGGSGIAPMLAHLNSLRENDSKTCRSVLFSTRTNQVCAPYGDSYPNETIITRLSDVDGRFSDVEFTEAIQDCDLIMICGSRAFVSHVYDLVHRAFPEKQILAEAFSLF